MREQAHIAHCRSCQAEIVFLRSNREPKPGQKRSLMPVDAETVNTDDFQFDPARHTSHFATCPNAQQHRRVR